MSGTKLKVRSEENEVLAGMPPALQQIYEDIRKLTLEGVRNDVWINYSIGLKVTRVDNGGESKYGKAAVPRLAAALGFHASTLYECASIVQAWNKAELTTLLKDAQDKGMMLTYSHLSNLASIKAPKARERMTNKVIAEQLTVRELFDLIRSNATRRDPGKAGRKPNMPRSPKAGLSQMLSVVHRVRNYQDVWEKSIFDGITETPPNELSDDTIESLVAVEKEWKALSDMADRETKLIRQTINRVKGILSDREEAEAAVSEEESSDAEETQETETTTQAPRKRPKTLHTTPEGQVQKKKKKKRKPALVEA